MSSALDRSPIVTVIGTAAVITRAPLKHPARLRRTVLGGSGVFMCAALIGIGQPTRLACHVGQDPEGDRIRAWAAGCGVSITPGFSCPGSVHLVQEFTGNEGMIVAGTPDPGPTPEQAKLAAILSNLLLIGDTSTSTLALITERLRQRRHANQPTPSVVANLSAATVRAWPHANQLWRLAHVVTIGEQELSQLNLTHSDARGYMAATGTLAITSGPGPVVVYSPSGEVETDVPLIADPIDTMGAGDAFAVALVHGLNSGLPIDRCVDFAISAAQLMCLVDSVEELLPGGWAAREGGPD